MLESIRRTFSKTRRVRDLARIGGAFRRMSRSSGDERQRAEQALASLLADARGLPMKIGQFLADGVNREAYRSLVEGVAPIPLEEIRPAIEHSLGVPISSVFSHFEESTAAASLGQVHRARLHDGTDVAVKVRYPGLPVAVDAELRLVGLLPGVGPVRKWGFDFEAYRLFLAEDLARELDYRGEAERQKRFRNALNIRGLAIPDVFDSLCQEDLLVQTWEEGRPLEEFATAPLQERLELARVLAKALFRSLFSLGEVHGDPHMGNLKVRRSAQGRLQVVLLDFGCTVAVSRDTRLALLKLILAARGELSNVAPLQAFAAMGFDASKLQAIAASLPALTKLLLQPFHSDELLNLDTWNLGARLERLLGEHRWWFRSAAPAESLLLLRAFHGFFIQLRTLKIALPWWPVLLECLDRSTLEEAESFQLPPLPPGLRNRANDFEALANSLCVRVREGGDDRVSVSMPAEAALDLRGIVPEEILDAIAESGLDLDAIEKRVRESGVAPQDIFSVASGEKRIAVWLE